MDLKIFQNRLYFVMGLVGLVVLVFIGKLFYVQIIHADAYQQLADRQYVSSNGRTFDRGNIYFSEKDGALVSAGTIRSGFRITAHAASMTSIADVYNQIGELLTLDEKSFTDQLGRSKNRYIDIASNISEPIASEISEKKIPGIAVSRMNTRFYPAGSLASHAIGFMAFKGDDFLGRYGVERFYETILQRTDQRLYVNFFAEIFSDLRTLLQEENQVEGDVVTSLEPTVQKNLEQVLADFQTKWNADRVGGIIMNPQTGAIYAMALDNGFNLNETRTFKNVSQFNNPLVENVFEVGSIMKPVIMAIALDQGVVTPETTYFDQGTVKVGDRTIYNFDKKGRGLSTMQTVLNQSLNTGMVFVMQKMQKDLFKMQWEKFGFNQKTGIDLPGEVSGLTSNLNTNRDVEYANVSFGQGVAVSPMEMIRALAVLANGGYLVTPHLGTEIHYPSGFKKKLVWDKDPVALIKPETATTITSMLVNVFDNYSNGTIKFDHYSVAAKTGTAQIPNHTQGGYYTDRNLHTFMAYFPAYKPEFIVFLYSEYPKNGAIFSSQTLLPPFVDMAKFLLSYYNIPPDR